MLSASTTLAKRRQRKAISASSPENPLLLLMGGRNQIVNSGNALQERVQSVPERLIAFNCDALSLPRPIAWEARGFHPGERLARGWCRRREEAPMRLIAGKFSMLLTIACGGSGGYGMQAAPVTSGPEYGLLKRVVLPR